MDLEIHSLLNQIRRNPKMILPHLEKMASNFDGMVLKRPEKGVNLRT